MRLLTATVAALFLTACEQAAQMAPAATISATQFRTIGWIEGTWRGTGPDGVPFFESYRLQDDSTLASITWTDSISMKPTDGSLITLRAGEVRSGSAPNGYVVTLWAGDTIRFDPRGTSSNAFTWTRVDADNWTAHLTWTDRQGRAQQRVYRMVRVGSESDRLSAIRDPRLPAGPSIPRHATVVG